MKGCWEKTPPPSPSLSPHTGMDHGVLKEPESPPQPQKCPQLISGGTLAAALLSPHKPSTTPALLRNPICWEKKPSITILLYLATATKPRKLRRGDKKKKTRQVALQMSTCSLSPVLQPSVLVALHVSHAAELTPEQSNLPEGSQDMARSPYSCRVGSHHHLVPAAYGIAECFGLEGTLSTR